MTNGGNLGRAAVAAVTAVVVLGACGDDGGGGSQPGPTDAYIAVLDWLLDQPGAAFGDECDDEIVYIESIGSEVISLDTQVELIDHYTEELDLRFIDTREEAVDETMDEAPVQSQCVLIGLGAAPDGMEIGIRGEIYRNQDDVDGYRFELAGQRDTWRLTGDPTPVDPEGLIGEP